MAYPHFASSLKILHSLIRQACQSAFRDDRPLPWRLDVTDGEGCAMARATVTQFRDGALEFETASSEATEYRWPVMVVLTDASDRQTQMSVA